MSAPTRHAKMVWAEEPRMAHGVYLPGSTIRDVTPADVRLWLLDHGAEERSWCEVHADYAMKHLGTSCRWSLKVLANRPRVPCRMVSVLVWRGGEQQ